MSSQQPATIFDESAAGHCPIAPRGADRSVESLGHKPNFSTGGAADWAHEAERRSFVVVDGVKSEPKLQCRSIETITQCHTKAPLGIERTIRFLGKSTLQKLFKVTSWILLIQGRFSTYLSIGCDILAALLAWAPYWSFSFLLASRLTKCNTEWLGTKHSAQTQLKGSTAKS